MKKSFRKYGKSVSIFLLAAVVVSSFVIAVNVFNPSKVAACRDQGCSAGYWRNHTDKWVGYETDTLVRELFSEADRYNLGGTTLINALNNNWGYGCWTPVGMAARALLRQGVAARLNISNPEVDYRVSGSQVIQIVNNALASGNIWTICNAARLLDSYNNAGCPFGQEQWPHHHH
jgi:hypothetical protein